MALPIAVGLMLFLVDVFYMTRTIGRATIPLEYIIQDDETWQPLAGAEIQLPGTYPAVKVRIGTDGHVRLAAEALTFDHSSLLRHTRYAYYPGWLKINADGYSMVQDDLNHFTSGILDRSVEAPPPTVIRLRKQQSR